MMLPMFLLLVAAVFLTQLVFCLYAKKLWIKLLPICTMGAMELLCLCLFLAGKMLEREDVLSFPAVIFGYVGCYWTAATVLAWGIYAIVNIVQKRRNKFVM